MQHVFIKIFITVNLLSGQTMNRGLHACNMEIVTPAFCPGTHPNCLLSLGRLTDRALLISFKLGKITKEKKKTLIIQV